MSRSSQMARSWVDLSSRHPFGLLLVFSVITALSVWGTVLIFGKVQMNLKKLLPEDTPSVRALELSETRRGSSDLFIIAVESPDPYANVEFVQALQARIDAEWGEESQWTQVEQDPTFFREHALLYLPPERLRAFRQQLSRALRCELQEVNAAFVELGDACEDQAAVEWTLDAWLGDDLMRELGLPDEFFGQWSDTLDAPVEVVDAGDDQSPTSSEGARPVPTGGYEAVPDDLEHYLIAFHEGVFISVLYAQMNRPSTDIEFANMMERRGSDLIASMDPARFHPEMVGQVSGPYQSLNEAREAATDSLYALLISLVFVIGVMLVFFRAIRGLVVVLVPLLMGVAWTMGLSWLVFGELNLYTMFVGSVLVGMGIDFGIHLYGRALEAFRGGAEWKEALTEALTHTGPAMMAAAVTTIGALLTLLVSHFEGFKEFGAIASYGIVFCMVTAYLVIPPMVFALEAIKPMKRKPQTSGSPASRVRPRIWIFATLVMSVAVMVACGLAPQAEFEYDFRNLRGPSSHGGIRYGKAMGKSRSGSPSLILADTPEQMHEIHQALRHRFAEQRDPMLKGFLTIETYCPPDQSERMEIINTSEGQPDDPFSRRRRDDIASVVNRSVYDRLEGEAADFVSVLRDLVEVEPFTLEDIPPWAYRTLQEADGSVGSMGLIFRSLNVWDMLEVAEYQSRYASFELEGGEIIPVADATFISTDIVQTVQADGRRMGGLVFAIVVIVLFLALRSIAGGLLCLITLVAAFVLSLGLMVTTGTRVGMYNMIVLPAVLGVSIDGAIHMYHRYVECDGDVSKVMGTTGIAVAAASLTTAGGFAGLLFQEHLGIRSIGALALIGILSALAAVVFLMPGILAALSLRRRTR